MPDARFSLLKLLFIVAGYAAAFALFSSHGLLGMTLGVVFGTCIGAIVLLSHSDNIILLIFTVGGAAIGAILGVMLVSDSLLRWHGFTSWSMFQAAVLGAIAGGLWGGRLARLMNLDRAISRTPGKK